MAGSIDRWFVIGIEAFEDMGPPAGKDGMPVGWLRCCQQPFLVSNKPVQR